MVSAMLRLLMVLLLGVTTVSIMGCETTKGVGRDIENVGEEIDDAVDDDDVDVDLD